MSPLSTHFLTMLLFIHLPDGYVNLPRLDYPQKNGLRNTAAHPKITIFL